MNKLLVLFISFFCWTSLKAHNPNTTSVVFTPTNGTWSVHFVISQEGANYALQKFYSDIDLQNQSIEKYKELYIDYIKKQIDLNIDGSKISIGSGGIKLGNHQTDIRFLLPNFPKDYKTIALRLSAFDENENQNTVVRFIEGKKEFRKVLNSKNGFSFTFENTPKGFIGKQDKYKTNIWYYLIPAFGIVILIIIVGKKKKNWWQHEAISNWGLGA